jgi:hypothetical protein
VPRHELVSYCYIPRWGRRSLDNLLWFFFGLFLVCDNGLEIKVCSVVSSSSDLHVVRIICCVVVPEDVEVVETCR